MTKLSELPDYNGMTGIEAVKDILSAYIGYSIDDFQDGIDYMKSLLEDVEKLNGESTLKDVEKICDYAGDYVNGNLFGYDTSERSNREELDEILYDY